MQNSIECNHFNFAGLLIQTFLATWFYNRSVGEYNTVKATFQKYALYVSLELQIRDMKVSYFITGYALFQHISSDLQVRINAYVTSLKIHLQ